MTSVSSALGTVSRRLVAAVVLIAAGVVFAAYPRAEGRYTFTTIHNVGATAVVPGVPALNNVGQVAYQWNADVYVGDGTSSPVRRFLHQTNVYPGNAEPIVAINDNGDVAFTAFHFNARRSLLVNGGVAAAVSTGWNGIAHGVSINNAGAVAFAADPALNSRFNVWVWRAGTFTKIAGIGTIAPDATLTSAVSPHLNDNGDVAFTGRWGSGAWHVYTSIAGVLSSSIGAVTVDVQGLNNASRVAYYEGGQILTGTSSSDLQPIKTPGAPYTVLSSAAAINDAGDVAYKAALPSNAAAIFVGNTSGHWPVLEPGDVVPGLGAVRNASIGNDALNNSGQVALLVEYDDGSGVTKRAIVRADPVDPDSDGDGVNDDEDAFPDDPTESRDTDGDGTGDNADADDDQDGQTDADETACGSDPLNAASLSPDTDRDGRPDCVDVNAPPTISVPQTIFAEATSPAGALVDYVVGVQDPDDAGLVAECAPASGSTFAIGPTTVSCAVEDGAGNQASAMFAVVVRDTTRPGVVVDAPRYFDIIVADINPVVDVRVTAADIVGVASVTARADVICEPDFSACSATTATIALQRTAGTAQSGTWTGQVSHSALRRTRPYILRVTVTDAWGNQRALPVYVDNDGIGPYIDRARSDYSIDQSTISSREFNTGTTAGTIHHETGVLSVYGTPGAGVRITAELVTPFLTLPPHGGMCTGSDKQFFLDATGETLDLECFGDTVRAKAIVALPEIVIRKLRWGQRCEYSFPFLYCEDKLYWVYAGLRTRAAIKTGSPFEADPENEEPIVLDVRRVEDDGSEVTVATIKLDPGESADPSLVAGPASGSELLVVTALAGDIEVTVAGATTTVPAGQTSSVAVRKAEQTITFEPLPDVPFGGPSIALTASASSGLPVAYTATGSCTVSGSTLSLVGVNTCSVTASQPGSDLYHAAASVTQTFRVTHSWSGLLSPLSSGAVRRGNTVPVKFMLTGGSAGVTDLAARLSISQTVSGAATDASAAGNRIDGLFRYDPSAGQYIFNWNTKGLSAGGWVLRIDLLDGTTRTAIVELR